MSVDDRPDGGVQVAVTYRAVWDDGLGARGWKLDVSIGEPWVIASTAETGTRIPTSVLVHDLLDHHLCGVRIGGHRNEAIALVQLWRRTGSDPRPDFGQIVDEDLMHGRVNGESLREFLPERLVAGLDPELHDGAMIIAALERRLGRPALRSALIDRFLALGLAGEAEARRSWDATGLDYDRRPAFGRALQRVLAAADYAMLERGIPAAQGSFVIDRGTCALNVNVPAPNCFQAVV